MMHKKLLVCVAVSLILGSCANPEFWKVVEEQRAQGYKWKEIPCRPPLNYPNMPLETPTGKKLICNVLVPPA